MQISRHQIPQNLIEFRGPAFCGVQKDKGAVDLTDAVGVDGEQQGLPGVVGVAEGDAVGFFIVGVGDSILVEPLVAVGFLQDAGKLQVDRIRAVVRGEEL